MVLHHVTFISWLRHLPSSERDRIKSLMASVPPPATEQISGANLRLQSDRLAEMLVFKAMKKVRNSPKFTKQPFSSKKKWGMVKAGLLVSRLMKGATDKTPTPSTLQVPRSQHVRNSARQLASLLELDVGQLIANIPQKSKAEREREETERKDANEVYEFTAAARNACADAQREVAALKIHAEHLRCQLDPIRAAASHMRSSTARQSTMPQSTRVSESAATGIGAVPMPSEPESEMDKLKKRVLATELRISKLQSKLSEAHTHRKELVSKLRQPCCADNVLLERRL